jgi:hypothetical protein
LFGLDAEIFLSVFLVLDLECEVLEEADLGFLGCGDSL